MSIWSTFATSDLKPIDRPLRVWRARGDARRIVVEVETGFIVVKVMVAKDTGRIKRSVKVWNGVSSFVDEFGNHLNWTSTPKCVGPATQEEIELAEAAIEEAYLALNYHLTR